VQGFFNGEIEMAMKEPKTWTIASRDWGITSGEAADILVSAEEIKKNKPLRKAAMAELKARKKAIDKIV
jgi:ATP-dependent protease ClpP protease subunit